MSEFHIPRPLILAGVASLQESKATDMSEEATVINIYLAMRGMGMLLAEHDTEPCH